MILKLDKLVGLEKMVELVSPEIEAVELPKSQADRLSDSVRAFLRSRGVFIITRHEGLGRPGFRKSAELVQAAKELKRKGFGLTRAAKELGIPESTLYSHIWKDLKKPK